MLSVLVALTVRWSSARSRIGIASSHRPLALPRGSPADLGRPRIDCGGCFLIAHARHVLFILFDPLVGCAWRLLPCASVQRSLGDGFDLWVWRSRLLNPISRRMDHCLPACRGFGGLAGAADAETFRDREGAIFYPSADAGCHVFRRVAKTLDPDAAAGYWRFLVNGLCRVVFLAARSVSG